VYAYMCVCMCDFSCLHFSSEKYEQLFLYVDLCKYTRNFQLSRDHNRSEKVLKQAGVVHDIKSQ